MINLYLIDKYAGSILDTLIETQEEFELLLGRRIRNFEEGAEFTLTQYLGKDVRRLNGKLSLFEDKLIENIKSGFYKDLYIGEKKKNPVNSTEDIQQFIKLKDPRLSLLPIMKSKS